ncbi:unnamed protein product [Lota lota]
MIRAGARGPGPGSSAQNPRARHRGALFPRLEAGRTMSQRRDSRSFSLNSSQSEAVHKAMQNGQKASPLAPPSTLPPSRIPAHSGKQQEVLLDCSTPPTNLKETAVQENGQQVAAYSFSFTSLFSGHQALKPHDSDGDILANICRYYS